MAAVGVKATQAGILGVLSGGSSFGLKATQAGIIAVTGPAHAAGVQVTQAAVIILLQRRPFIATPPAIKMPCHTNCLQFFDNRKRA